MSNIAKNNGICILKRKRLIRKQIFTMEIMSNDDGCSEKKIKMGLEIEF